MATKLPYLNVLEVDSVNKEDISRAIVIDKDEYVKALDIEQITTYQGLSNKPKINGVELNGDMSLDELNVASKDELDKVKTDLAEVEDSIPSFESIQNRIDDSLLNYPTKTEVTEEIIDSIKNKADKSEIPTKVSQLDNDKGYLTAIPEEYVTSSELEAKDYATKSYLSNQLNETLDDYYTKEQINNKGYLTEIPEEYITDEELQAKNYATEQWVEDKGYLTSIPTEYVTETELNGKGYATEQWVEDKGYLTSVPSEYVTETELDTVLYETLNEYVTESELALKEFVNTDALNQALTEKQDVLVSGDNIKTINGNSLLGSGDIIIQPEANIPTLKFNYDNNLFEGDFDEVFRAINNINRAFSIYLPMGTAARIEATQATAVGNSIQAIASITYNGHTTYLNYTINRDGTSTSSSSTFDAQGVLIAGDNIDITDNTISWVAPNVQFVNTIFTDDQSLKYAIADFNGGYTEKEFPLATTESAGLMSPEDKSKLDAGITGTTDYNDLTNKPSINGVTLEGNKDYTAFGLASAASVTSLDSQVIKKYSGTSTVNQISIIRVLTQEEYDALGEYDNSTQYLIV